MKKMVFSIFSAAVVTLLGFAVANAGGPPVPTPEPGTLMILGAGLAGLIGTGLFIRRKK